MPKCLFELGENLRYSGDFRRLLSERSHHALGQLRFVLHELVAATISDRLY